MTRTPSVWFTEVIGDPHYVDDLPYFFPTGESFAYVEEGRTWIRSTRFQISYTPTQVQAEAERVLDEMSGALCVFLGHYVRPSVGTVYLLHEDGHRTGHQFLKVDSLVVRTKFRAKLAGSDGPTLPQQFIGVAAKSSHLQTACLIWMDQVRTWPRLYRIMEEVQQHLRMPAYAAGLCSRSEYKNFERTANSAEVAGIDARHALGRFEPPTDPMSLRTAEVLVGRVLERAFRMEVTPKNEA